MANLETELKRGRANFEARGKVKISDDTFQLNMTSKTSTYKYSRANFRLDMDNGRSAFVQMMGGYDPARPTLMRFSEDRSAGMLSIPWEYRDKEEMVSQVARSERIIIKIERDDSGKLIEKEFISEMDALDYLQKHLSDDTPVFVSGNVDYQLYNGDVQRSFEIKRITALTPFKDEKTGEERYTDFGITMQQTYLLNKDSFGRKYEEELEEGQTTVSAFVPQYLSKFEGQPLKKVVPLKQTFLVKAEDEDKAKKLAKAIDRFLLVKDSDVVREVTLDIEVFNGFSQSTGEVELTDELKELIELGLTTEEEVKRQVTVNGTRVQENVFKSVVTRREEGVAPRPMISDRYEASVLDTPLVKKDDAEEITNPFGDDAIEDLDDVLFG